MPQQYALPEALRAHECLLPASTSTDTPVAVKSTVLGNAAAAAVSLFPANAVLDPSTHGAEAQPVDPVRATVLVPPPTVPPPPVTVNLTGSSTSGRGVGCNLVKHTVGSTSTLVPVRVTWLSVAASFTNVAVERFPFERVVFRLGLAA